jgi:hypothetical protein
MTASSLDIRRASMKADLIRIETARIEGSLRSIRDVGGMQAAETAARAALQRVCRSAGEEGWVA